MHGRINSDDRLGEKDIEMRWDRIWGDDVHHTRTTTIQWRYFSSCWKMTSCCGLNDFYGELVDSFRFNVRPNRAFHWCCRRIERWPQRRTGTALECWCWMLIFRTASVFHGKLVYVNKHSKFIFYAWGGVRLLVVYCTHIDTLFFIFTQRWKVPKCVEIRIKLEFL